MHSIARAKLPFVVPCLAVILCACASTPKVSVGYYLARTELSIKAIRTIACDSDKKPIIEQQFLPTATFVADTRETLPIYKLDGALSNTTAKLSFYGDGRLSGINATATGQGPAILKSIATVASAVLLNVDPASTDYSTACDYVAKHADDKTKTLTIVYETKVNLADKEAELIEPVLASKFHHDEIKSMIGDLYAAVTKTESRGKPVEIIKASPSAVMLTLREPAVTTVQVLSVTGGEYWSTDVLDAAAGERYSVPIPRAAAFGKQEFEVEVAESGALKSLKYGKDSGVGGAFDALDAVAGVLQGPTAAEQAAALEAEADLIAQQQRLVQCRADPAACKWGCPAA